MAPRCGPRAACSTASPEIPRLPLPILGGGAKTEGCLGFAALHDRGAPMLNINGITVRLGGRTILDRATATLPPRSRVGLIGRNGAGKSTLMKVMIGQLEPDDGEHRDAAQARASAISRRKRPSGTATPFETVLAADTERAALLAESGDLPRSRPARRNPRAADRDRRLYRAGARRAHPGRARLRRGDAGPPARQLFGRLEDARRARRAAVLASPTCCCSTSRRTISISKRRCGWRISCKAYRGDDRRRSATSATCSTMSSITSCISRAAR